MKEEGEILHQGTFHKAGCPDAHVSIRWGGPEAFYVDVREGDHTWGETWSTMGPEAVNDVELVKRYEEEFRLKGYGPGEWGQNKSN
jgi:hypothetical protein